MGKPSGTAVLVGALIAISHSYASAELFTIIRGETSYCDAEQSLVCRRDVQCPDGLVAWGGGVSMLRGKVQESYPSDARTWSVTIAPARLELGPSVVAVFEPFVTCAPEPSGYEHVHAQNFSMCPVEGTNCTESITCPVGKAAISGGVSSLGSLIESVYPDGEGWTINWYPDFEEVGPGGPGWARTIIICADAVPDGYAVKRGTSEECPAGSLSDCANSVQCADGLAAYATGFLGGRAKISSLITDRVSSQAAWYPASHEYPNQSGYGTPFAICAAGRTAYDAVFTDGFD